MKWAAGLVLVAAIGYGILQTFGFPFDADDLTAVDSTVLSASEQRTALRARTGRCGCGCGMTLAQCVAIDMTVRSRRNIDRLKTMVQEARRANWMELGIRN